MCIHIYIYICLCHWNYFKELTQVILGNNKSELGRSQSWCCYLESKGNLLLCSHLVVSDSEISWTAACQAFLSFTISLSLLKLMSIELTMPYNHFILCHPFLQIDHGARYVLTQILQRRKLKFTKENWTNFHSVQLNGIQLVMRFRLEWNSVPCQSLFRFPCCL